MCVCVCVWGGGVHGVGVLRFLCVGGWGRVWSGRVEMCVCAWVGGMGEGMEWES